jgi:hypothetical protein
MGRFRRNPLGASPFGGRVGRHGQGRRSRSSWRASRRGGSITGLATCLGFVSASCSANWADRSASGPAVVRYPSADHGGGVAGPEADRTLPGGTSATQAAGRDPGQQGDLSAATATGRSAGRGPARRSHTTTPRPASRSPAHPWPGRRSCRHNRRGSRRAGPRCRTIRRILSRRHSPDLTGGQT